MAGVFTKRALPRRTFLRASGVAVALPWLEAMVPALSAAPPAGPARLGFFYVPNGMAIQAWRAAAGGPCPALTGLLTPLDALRTHVTVVSGLGQPAAQQTDGAGPYPRAAAAWLSGMPLTMSGSRVRGAITADQIAARDVGRHTPVASLELIAGTTARPGDAVPTPETACRTISWRGPDAPNPMAWDPRAVFARLFGSADDELDGTGSDQSLLDGLVTNTRALERKLGASDRAVLDDYLTAIRAVEQRLTPPHHQLAARVDAAPPDAAHEEDPVAHAGQLLDLLYLAYRADLTRVATFMFGPEGSGDPEVFEAGRATSHAVAHAADDSTRDEVLATFERACLAGFARFCERLRATPEGEATLLDRAAFLYGAGFSDRDRHTTVDLPLLVVGGANGALAGNQHVAYRGTDPEPMTNLLLALLVKADVRAGRLGDSTGVLPGI